MLIIDSHLDLSWNALGWNRDLRQTAHETRAAEAGMMAQGHGRGMGTVSFPDLRRGQVGICVATFLARTNGRGTYVNLDFRTRRSLARWHEASWPTIGNWRRIGSAGLSRIGRASRRVMQHG